MKYILYGLFLSIIFLNASGMQSDDTGNNPSINKFKHELEKSGNKYCKQSAVCLGLTLFLGLSYTILPNDILLYSAYFCLSIATAETVLALKKYYKAQKLSKVPQ